MDNVAVGLGLLGLMLIAAGTLFRLGILKYWFLARRVPGLVPRFGAYLGIPAGISLLLMACMPLLPSVESRRHLSCAASVVMLGGSILAVIRTSFLVPEWLKWLEQEHASITPLLIQEGREMGVLNWQARVWTRRDLEEWVEEVRRKHSLI